MSGNNFVIYLSEVATIINGNLIQFIDNSPPTINFNGCRYIDGTLRFVRTFSTAILKLPTKTPVIIPVATFAQALLTTPFPLFSLCTTVNLEIVNYKYTALRIPNNIRWTVDKMKKEDAALKAKLQAILDGQNSL